MCWIWAGDKCKLCTSPCIKAIGFSLKMRNNNSKINTEVRKKRWNPCRSSSSQIIMIVWLFKKSPYCVPKTMRIIVEWRKCKTESSSWKNTRTIKIQSIYRQSRMTLNGHKKHFDIALYYMHVLVHLCMVCIHAIEICKFTQANCFLSSASSFSFSSISSRLSSSWYFKQLFTLQACFAFCMSSYAHTTQDDSITEVPEKYSYMKMIAWENSERKGRKCNNKKTNLVYFIVWFGCCGAITNFIN